MVLLSFTIYVFNFDSKASTFLGKNEETGEKHLALHEAQFENHSICRSLHLGEWRSVSGRRSTGCVSGCAKASSCKKLSRSHVPWEHRASREYILPAMLGITGFGDVRYNNKNLTLFSEDVIRHLKLELSPQTALNADCPLMFGVPFVTGRRKGEQCLKFSH